MNFLKSIKSYHAVLVLIINYTSYSQHDYTEPDVSPNGKYLVFCSNETSENALYISRVDGSEKRLLIDLDGYESAPNWSPNGKRICFYVMDKHGDSNMYLINKDGTAVKQIEGGKIENPESPTWLSNRKLLFTAGVFPNKNIFTYDLKTKLTEQLTHLNGINYYPDLKRGKLVFCKFSREEKGIYLKDLSSHDKFHLTSLGEAPVFDKRGKIVVYQGKSNEDAVTGLRLIDLKTKHDIALTNNAELSELPDIDHKNRYVYYQRKVGGHFSIWRINMDGTQNTKIIGG